MEHPDKHDPDIDGCNALNVSLPSSSIDSGKTPVLAAATFSNQADFASVRRVVPSRHRSFHWFLFSLFGFLGVLFVSNSAHAHAHVLPYAALPDASAFPVSQDGRNVDINVQHATILDASFPNNNINFLHFDPASLAGWIQSVHGQHDSKFVDELIHSLQTTVQHHHLNPNPTQQQQQSQLRFWKRADAGNCNSKPHQLSEGKKALFAVLIPVLVILSGLFAGLTLGYMSLDETQLQVLSMQGTPQQKRYAEKIVPIRKDGHLLLATLLIANMITNETLPIVADPLLGGGLQAVIVSIILVVIFAELIPQSVCSRYGLAIGAALAPLTRCVIILLWPIAWPLSRVLHWTLGAHHGIVYRRAELKELVNMHAAIGGRGDLNVDTVTIVGGALDLQEKVVQQAMTRIEDVFMIPIDAHLDYTTLEKIVSSGHSRIPVYQEIDIPVGKSKSGTATPTKGGGGGFLSAISRRSSFSLKQATTDEAPSVDATIREKDSNANNKSDGMVTTIKKKKIIGALLVKQCVLLDPEDSTPVRDMVINALPTIPADEPLLNLLNVFQEGRSHLAIVSSRTRRFTPGSFVDLGVSGAALRDRQGKESAAARIHGLGNIDEEKQLSHSEIKKDSIWSRPFRRHKHNRPAENLAAEMLQGNLDMESVATEMAQRDVPIGIITLEDVLEELIGEEILDEYDSEVEQNFANITPPPSPEQKMLVLPSDMADVEETEVDEFSMRPSAIKFSNGSSVLQRLKLGRNSSQRDMAASYINLEKAMSPSQPLGGGGGGGLLIGSGSVGRKDQASEEPKASSGIQSDPAMDPCWNVSGLPSRPPSPVNGSRDEGGVIVCPRPSKPVVIRHQAPDGSVATAIVGESVLRVRAGVVTERAADMSRSSTPSGQKVSRFKSTPIVGSSPLPPLAQRQKSLAPTDSLDESTAAASDGRDEE